jgi:hypothetical protein
MDVTLTLQIEYVFGVCHIPESDTDTYSYIQRLIDGNEITLDIVTYLRKT